MLAAETNRLHKVLDDGGIKLGGVVSDINGVSARAMVSALIEGQPIEHILGLARGKLKQKGRGTRRQSGGRSQHTAPFRAGAS